MNGSGIETEESKPWFNWYAWHCTYWGTKWNAYDGYTEQGKSFLTFVFSTAWSLPTPIIERLSVLGYDFEVYYADEDWGCNCGKIKYNKKEQLWTREDEYSIKNPRDYAKRIWDKY